MNPVISTIPKQFEWLYKNCTDEPKTKILAFRDLILQFDERNGEFPETGQIKYGKSKSEAFIINLRRKKEWTFPKLFVKLPLPYAKKPGLSDRLGWMSLITEDWQTVQKVFYHPKNRRGYYRVNQGKTQLLSRLISHDEQIAYLNQSLTQLEMVIDKALKVNLTSFLGTEDN